MNRFTSRVKWIAILLLFVAPAATVRAADDSKTDDAKPAKADKSKVKVAVIELKGSYPEGAEAEGLFAEISPNLNRILDRLNQAAKDDKIAAVILEVRDPEVGRAKVNEIRAAIAAIRKAGKKVYADVRSADSKQYLIASACNEIIMPESGTLTVMGVRAELTFYKDLLDKLGVKAEIMQMGAYKGASEPMTRSGMSPEFRKQFELVIDDFYAQLVDTIVADRHLDHGKVKDLIDEGLLTATGAKEAGLIDRVQYIDQFRDDLAKTLKVDEIKLVKDYGKKEVDADLSSFAGMIKFMQMVMGIETPQTSGKNKKIAVIYAVGVINSGESGGGLFDEASLGGDTLIKAIHQAEEDSKVVAIVLRIDSPGGSALASDLMWREIVKCKKPIIASMGDTAASGGYYIAMGAKKIFCEPGTLTGSIGVVGGKVALKGLFDKIGIKTDVISRGKNSGLESMDEPFSPSERDAWMKSMHDIYRQFTTKASEGRKIELKKLQEDLAGGRVWSGKQAVNNKLADKLGTLDDAVAEAKSMAGLKAEDAVDRLNLPKPKSFLENLFGGSSTETRLKSAAPELAEGLAKLARIRRMFSERAALVLPCEIDIK